jgi:hypothetical protein
MRRLRWPQRFAAVCDAVSRARRVRIASVAHTRVLTTSNGYLVADLVSDVGGHGAGANSHHQNLDMARCQRVGQAHEEWPSTSETPAMAPGVRAFTVSGRARRLRCFVQLIRAGTHPPQRYSQRAEDVGASLPTFWRCEFRRSTARAGEVQVDWLSYGLATGGKYLESRARRIARRPTPPALARGKAGWCGT